MPAAVGTSSGPPRTPISITEMMPNAAPRKASTARPATPSPGFTGAAEAKASYGEIFSHVQTKDPQFWNEVMKTVGATDLYVQQNTWDPATCGSPGCIPSTGWHTHPGPSFVIVTQGSVTVYDGDDPACTPHVYTANTPNNAFIDLGGDHVHIIRDESGAVVMRMRELGKIAFASALAAPAALARPGPPRPWQLTHPSLPHPAPPGMRSATTTARRGHPPPK